MLRKLGIFVVDGFLPPALSAKLVAESTAATPKAAMVVENHGPVIDRTARRTSEFTLTESTAETVNNRLSDLRPALADWIGRPLGRFTQPVLLRYEVGDYFRPHADVGPNAEDDVRLLS